MANICVFCSASQKVLHEPYLSASESVGAFIAKEQHILVYGGAAVGLMRVVADSCLAQGGKVIGVLPHFLKKVEIAHSQLTQMIYVSDLMERKKQMMALADAFIILPGGLGTLDECFEVLTAYQLHQHSKTIAILNINQFYNPLLACLHTFQQQGFLNKDILDSIVIESEMEALFHRLHAAL